MNPNPIPDPHIIQSRVNDPIRLEAMNTVKRFIAARDGVFDQLTKQAALILDAPIALISLVDQGVDHIISQKGIPDSQTKTGSIDAQPSFCELTVAQDGPVIIDDTANHPTLRLFPSVQHMGVRAHLGVPLYYNDQAIGNCCVIDYKPRHWTPEDLKVLTNLAQKAMNQIKSQSKNQIPLL